MRSCPRSRRVASMPHQVPKPADQATKQQGYMDEVHGTAEVATVLIRVVAAACEARKGELARSPKAPRQRGKCERVQGPSQRHRRRSSDLQEDLRRQTKPRVVQGSGQGSRKMLIRDLKQKRGKPSECTTTSSESRPRARQPSK